MYNPCLLHFTNKPDLPTINSQPQPQYSIWFTRKYGSHIYKRIYSNIKRERQSIFQQKKKQNLKI